MRTPSDDFATTVFAFDLRDVMAATNVYRYGDLPVKAYGCNNSQRIRSRHTLVHMIRADNPWAEALYAAYLHELVPVYRPAIRKGIAARLSWAWGRKQDYLNNGSRPTIIAEVLDYVKFWKEANRTRSLIEVYCHYVQCYNKLSDSVRMQLVWHPGPEFT